MYWLNCRAVQSSAPHGLEYHFYVNYFDLEKALDPRSSTDQTDALTVTDYFDIATWMTTNKLKYIRDESSFLLLRVREISIK